MHIQSCTLPCSYRSDNSQDDSNSDTMDLMAQVRAPRVYEATPEATLARTLGCVPSLEEVSSDHNVTGEKLLTSKKLRFTEDPPKGYQAFMLLFHAPAPFRVFNSNNRFATRRNDGIPNQLVKEELPDDANTEDDEVGEVEMEASEGDDEEENWKIKWEEDKSGEIRSWRDALNEIKVTDAQIVGWRNTMLAIIRKDYVSVAKHCIPKLKTSQNECDRLLSALLMVSIYGSNPSLLKDELWTETRATFDKQDQYIPEALISMLASASADTIECLIQLIQLACQFGPLKSKSSSSGEAWPLSSVLLSCLLLANRQFTRAMPHLRLAADYGHPIAMMLLGCSFMWGDGLEHNETEAVKWLTKAASAGNTTAMVNLGWCYLQGKGGLAVDRQKGVALYKESAEKGNGRAQMDLGRQNLVPTLHQNKEEGVRWLRLAAAQHYRGAEQLLDKVISDVGVGFIIS